MSFPQNMSAIVTGAGSGLGRELALDLAGRGARLMLADIAEGAVEQTAVLAREAGAEVDVISCDVGKRDSVFAMVDHTVSRFGRVDLIANNAGIAVQGEVEHTSDKDWRWVVDVNLWGVIYGCQAVLPHMKKANRGYVLNVASAAGLVHPPGLSAYNVTKAGVVALSETLYGETKHLGIHVSVLCPTFFLTNIMNQDHIPEAERKRAERWMSRSKVQAPEVARAAIDGVRDGKLHIVPMRDGRATWRAKRLSPQRFCNTLHSVYLKQSGQTAKG